MSCLSAMLMQEEDEKGKLMRVEQLLTYVVAYHKRRPVERFDETSILAAQMHELVTQQLDALCAL